MQTRCRVFRGWWMGVAVILAGFCLGSAYAALTPVSGDYSIGGEVAPDPPPFGELGSFAVYEDYLLYVSGDSQIHAYDMETGEEELVCNTALLAATGDVVDGLTVSREGFLYFHNNGTGLYRVNLKSLWPAEYTTYPTNCEGDIKVIFQNPWTGALYFGSCPEDDDFTQIYRAYPSFDYKVNVMKFLHDHGNAQGPMEWISPDALLCAEGPVLHLLEPGAPTDHRTKKLDYIILGGAVTGLVRGWDNNFYAAAGESGAIHRLQWDQTELVVQSDRNLGGLFFTGDQLFACELATARKEVGDATYTPISMTASLSRLSAADGWTSYFAGELPGPADRDFFSMPYWGSCLLYPAADDSIWYWDLSWGRSASCYAPGAGVSPGMLAVAEDKLYMLDDNESPRESIHVYDLSLSKAAGKEHSPVIEPDVVVTSCPSSVLWVAGNPEDSTVYAVSHEAAGDAVNFFYLLRSNDVVTPTRTVDWVLPHGGEPGPFLFKDSNIVYLVENTTGAGYLHEIDIVTPNPVTTSLESQYVLSDSVVFDSPVASLVYGQGNQIFATLEDGEWIHRIQFGQAVTVTQALQGGFFALSGDGNNLVAAQEETVKAPGDVSLDWLWEPLPYGVLAEDAHDLGAVDSRADLSVTQIDGDATIGLQGRSSTVVEFLEAIDPYELGEDADRPYFPMGMIGFRAKPPSGSITATVRVYFSDPVSQYAVWMKYLPDGTWYELPDSSVSDDGYYMDLEIRDGGRGDADGFQNGIVLDPGGPVQAKKKTVLKKYGDFTDDCFVDGSAPAHARFTGWLAAVLGALFLFLVWSRRTRTALPMAGRRGGAHTGKK